MTAVHQIVALAHTITVDAARWYTVHDVPRAFRLLHPLAVAEAAVLSGGDWRRCVADADGSVTVYNHRQWHHEGA